VIHSFWVPELAGKRDVVPGQTNTLTLSADKPGTYLGQCAEYCGLSHANMRFRVIAKSPADFQQWLREQQQGPANPLYAADGTTPAGPTQELLVNSKNFGCVNCHSVTNRSEGAGAEEDAVGSTIGPNLTRLGDRQAFAGDIFPMKLDDLTQWVYDAPAHKPAGPLQGWMPNFSEKGMTMEQAEDIARYLLCDTSTDPSSHPECT